MKIKSPGNNSTISLLILFMIMGATLFSKPLFAQTPEQKSFSLFSEGGIIITLILILTPILAGIGWVWISHIIFGGWAIYYLITQLFPK